MTTVASGKHQSCGWGEATNLRLVLLRHAQDQCYGRFCGHLDPDLSVEGRNTIAGLIQNIASMPPSSVWSSDLLRAQQTAAPIAKHFDLPLRTSVALREMNFGQWEGLSWKEVEARFPEDARTWRESFPHHRPPSGETFQELQRRVIAELERLANEEEPRTLVVTHAGFIRTAIAWVLAMPDDHILRIDLDYGGATVLRKAGGYWSVMALNASKFPFNDLQSPRQEDRTVKYFENDR